MSGWRKRQIMENVMSDYDYERFEGLLKQHLDVMWRDPDDLDIGEDISDCPEIKIIFDGHGDLEDEDENGEDRYTERGNKDMESYAIFIHKDSAKEGFVFPEHDQSPWCLIHRPAEEVCIYAWYDVKEDYWDFSPLEERVSDTEMDEDDVMKILEVLNKRYFDHTEL